MFLGFFPTSREFHHRKHLTSLLESIDDSLPETNSKLKHLKNGCGWFRRSGFLLWDDLSFKGASSWQFWGGSNTQVQRRKAFIKKKHGDSLAKVEANHRPVVKKGRMIAGPLCGFPFFLRSFVSTFFLVYLVSISY